MLAACENRGGDHVVARPLGLNLHKAVAQPLRQARQQEVNLTESLTRLNHEFRWALVRRCFSFRSLESLLALSEILEVLRGALGGGGGYYLCRALRRHQRHASSFHHNLRKTISMDFRRAQRCNKVVTVAILHAREKRLNWELYLCLLVGWVVWLEPQHKRGRMLTGPS